MQTNYNELQRNSIKKAFLFTLICFIMFTALYYIILQRDLAADKERYGYIARNQAEHIVTTIDCVMSRTNTLKTMIKENNGNRIYFQNPKKWYLTD